MLAMWTRRLIKISTRALELYKLLESVGGTCWGWEPMEDPDHA